MFSSLDFKRENKTKFRKFYKALIDNEIYFDVWDDKLGRKKSASVGGA